MLLLYFIYLPSPKKKTAVGGLFLLSPYSFKLKLSKITTSKIERGEEMELLSSILTYIASATIILGIFLPTAASTRLIETEFTYRFNFWKLLPVACVATAAYYVTSLFNATFEESSLTLLAHLAFMLAATGICGILSLEPENKKSFGIFCFISSAILFIACILIRTF